MKQSRPLNYRRNFLKTTGILGAGLLLPNISLAETTTF
ncbi:twin-arginine translocation signal domain-containing protein [Maribacter sp. MJ134]|nr:twin-arginine translocation signal domain-containing protein [Maribacter sp. MJ134]